MDTSHEQPIIEYASYKNVDMSTETIEDCKDIDDLKLQKMVFLYNALENGWQISKNGDKFIFIKKHEGKKEVFLDSYLQDFVNKNMDISSIVS